MLPINEKLGEYFKNLSEEKKRNQLSLSHSKYTVKFGYNDLGYNEQFLALIGHLITQNNPVVTNPGYDKQNS